MINRECVKRIESELNKYCTLYDIRPENLDPGLVLRCIIANDFTPLEEYCKGNFIPVNRFFNDFADEKCPMIERFSDSLYSR